MSGHEATRIIRTLPEPARSTPIVALTANVGPEDEARCRASGMDGILGKPVSVAELLQALSGHVWSAGRGGASPPQAGRVPPAEADDPRLVPVLATERINELRANLPPDTFANLIEECLVDMDHRLPALRRALTAGAPAAITAQAHALVGMAAGYGMAAVEARLRTIMAAARDGDMAPLGPAIIAELEADFAETAKTLRRALRTEVA
jgi:HPt (histidine-containing phosphotransfer) domain-containing protein